MVKGRKTIEIFTENPFNDEERKKRQAKENSKDKFSLVLQTVIDAIKIIAK